MPSALPLTGDPLADELLSEDPLALLIGMLLDQQVPMERAFHSPYDLKERMGGRLDAAEIADADPDELGAIFARTPALHRFPGSMAARTQAMCRILVDQYGGRAAAVWETAADGAELLANVKALPGFGEQKARIFIALLAKRLGVKPKGWEEVAGPYAPVGYLSVADIDGPEALARVREHKKAMKAAAKAAQGPAKAGPE
ncbi:MAG: HhH-GPD-type base excision DNA repair protein [Acidimicrobiales bacterium]